MTLRQLPAATALACGLLFAGAAHAQDAKPDAARVTAARRALEAGGVVDAMLAAIRANIPAQRAATPQLPAEFWTRFETRLVQDAPQLVDSIAVVYARTFTLEELDALTAFYRSPVGQRLRQAQPALVTETSGIGQRWGQRIGAEIGASLQNR